LNPVIKESGLLAVSNPKIFEILKEYHIFPSHTFKCCFI